MSEKVGIGDDLLILFPFDRRPGARQVSAACAGSDFVDSDGVSLQRSGLVFDLVGLSPGPAIPVPDMQPRDGEHLMSSRVHAVSLRLGPHIAAGKRSVAVLREWFALAQGIADQLEGVTICWVPGEVAIPTEKLAPHLAEWDARGQVPVGLLATFRRTLDGAIQSQGLEYFTGQEFRIEPPLVGGDQEPLARLLFAHLFFAGTQEETGQLTAPDGHALRLEPSANGRYVRVWPG